MWEFFCPNIHKHTSKVGYKQSSVFTNSVEYILMQKHNLDILINLKHYEDRKRKAKDKSGFYFF